MEVKDIIQMVKDDILKDGAYSPMLFVEIKATPDEPGGLILCAVDLPHSADERSAMFFGAGRQIGQEHPGQSIERVTFACEMWVSERVVTPGKPQKQSKRVPPSKDPQRKEIVMVLTAQKTGDDTKMEMYPYEMLRDGEGKLVDLLFYGEPQVVRDSLLTSFLRGFASAKLSDREIAAMLVSRMKR